MIECNKKTTNFSSGRALLEYYDADRDGAIGAMEQMQASADHTDGAITKEELDFVVSVWKRGEGGISKMCPSAATDIPWLLIGAAIILLYLLTRG